MKDLHDAPRQWLDERGYALPPWDPQAGAPHQRRSITYGGRLAATVTWTPQPSVRFADGLSGHERRGVLAMAIAAGARPEGEGEGVPRFRPPPPPGGGSISAHPAPQDPPNRPQDRRPASRPALP